jgi:hemoglobin
MNAELFYGFHFALLVAYWRDMNEPSLYERIGGRETLAQLLKHFYSDIRQHQLVGPIFNEKIHDWPSHLETIGSFWARLTGGPSNYAGGMPMKHMPLGLNATHFQAWLQLWEFNCRTYLKSSEAQEMINLANEIGRRLKSILGVTEFKLNDFKF